MRFDFAGTPNSNKKGAEFVRMTQLLIGCARVFCICIYLLFLLTHKNALMSPDTDVFRMTEFDEKRRQRQRQLKSPRRTWPACERKESNLRLSQSECDV